MSLFCRALVWGTSTKWSVCWWGRWKWDWLMGRSMGSTRKWRLATSFLRCWIWRGSRW